MKEDPLKLLQEAHNEFGRAREKLNKALCAWLEPYNFPAEIEQGFEIWFTSGGENIVTYNGRGEFEENQLEDLIGKSYEEIVEIFNC